MKKYNLKSLIILALFTLIALPMVGCEEEELYTLSQEEEVERYIADSYLGKAFFPNDFSSDAVSFNFPGDDTLYTVIFDRAGRNYSLYNLGDTVQLQTGEYYYCRAAVTERFYFTLRKSISGQVFESTVGEQLNRWGYLVKLGPNSQAYSGWLLQGIAAAPADVMNIQTLDGTNIRMDYISPLLVEGVQLNPPLPDGYNGFMDIDNISIVNGGSQIAVDTCGPCVTIAHYETESGFVAEVLDDTWTGPTCCIDTFAVGTDSEVIWTSLSLQTLCRVNDSTISHSIRYIPFKVNH